MGRAPALIEPALTLDAALAAAREAYVRRHPCSLARYVVAIATEDAARPAGALPFPLVIAGRAAGRVTTVDGDVLIDCRGDSRDAAMIPAWLSRGPDEDVGRKLIVLFHLDLLQAGALVGEDGGLVAPPDAADAELLLAAIAGFRRIHAGLLATAPSPQRAVANPSGRKMS